MLLTTAITILILVVVLFAMSYHAVTIFSVAKKEQTVTFLNVIIVLFYLLLGNEMIKTIVFSVDKLLGF